MEEFDSEGAEVIAVVEEPTAKVYGGAVLHIYGSAGSGKSVLAHCLLQQLLQEAMKATTAVASTPFSYDSLEPSSPSPSPQDPLLLGIDRPIILAYLPHFTGYSYQSLGLPHVATSTHHASHSLATLIAQYLAQDATSSHTLHRLRRAIAKRNKKQYWWTDWSDEDLWLLFDEMLGSREGRQVWIVIDSILGDDHGHTGPKWLLQRLVDRVASGGAEGDGLVKLIITTRAKGDIIAYPECRAPEGYAYHRISITTQALLNASSASIASQKLNEMEEGVVKRLLRRSGVTWLDLGLTCSLRVHPGELMELSNFFNDLESHGAHADDDGWIVRESLYSMHYSFVFIDPPSHKKWARLALGWLLYISAPIRTGPLAMAVAISGTWKLEANGLLVTSTKEENASENIHRDSIAILNFLRSVLVNTPFAQTVLATGDLDEGSTEHHKWGGEYISLRHGQVQRFLWSRVEKEEDLSSLPPFSDAGRWNELMALTCFEVMGLPGADQISFRGDGVGEDMADENELGLELGDYKFDEDIWQIEGAGEFGLGDEKVEDLDEDEVVESDVDSGDDSPAKKMADTDQNQRPRGTPQQPAVHPAQRALLAYAILNWPTHAKTSYESTHPTTNDDNSVLPTNPLTTVIINFMTCNINENEHMSWWGERFSFLTRVTSSTSPPLPRSLTHNPLQVSANLGLLPLVKYFSNASIYHHLAASNTSSPWRAQRETLKSKMLAMIAAATNGHIECFRHLFYMNTHYNYSVRYFFLPLVAAVRSGAVEVVKELLMGQEGKKVKQALADGPRLWNYGWVLKIAAESGNMEVMEVLLDGMPEGLRLFAANQGSHVAGEGGDKELKPTAQGGDGGDDGDDGSPLHFACRAGFTPIVKLLLHGNTRKSFQPFDPSTADAAGFTPLHHAARHGHLDTVKLLLAHPAVDVDTPGWAIKPLHLAAEKGYPRIVDELLRSHASASVLDHTGRSPLHKACIKGHLRCIKLLLRAGAPTDVSLPDKAGITPLHLAAECGSVAIANLLLAKGAKPDVTETKTLYTPLHYAAAKGFVQVARRLLECGAQCDPRLHEVEYTPLHLAAFNQRVDVCKVLLEHGSDVRAITKPNPTLFPQAKDCNVLMLTYGAPGLTHIFIDAKADVNHRDTDGATPLHMACLADSSEAVAMLIGAGAVAMLIGAGADINVPGTADNCTPLYIVARDNRLELAKLLIAHGVDVEKTTEECSQRPLHVAAAHGHTEIVVQLIHHGVNVNSVTQKSDSPKTALYLAALGGHIEVVRALLDNGAKTSLGNDAPEYEGMEHKYEYTALCTAAQDGCIEIVRLLLEKGVDVDQHAGGEDHGFTALYLALVNGHSMCARLLLEEGGASPVKATVKQGWMPLHAAASTAGLDSVRILLEHPGGPVDVNAATPDKGSTPLWLACRKQNGHEVVKLLLTHSADPTIASKDGWTTLHAAAEAGAIACLRELLHLPNIPLNATMTERNRTALFCAAWKGHRDCVAALLAAGADPSIKNSLSVTPLHAAARSTNIECVQLLLDAGVPATTKDDNGWTPLQRAAYIGPKEVVAMLLVQAPVLADIDYSSSGVSTALALAAQQGHEDICRLLLEKGAGVELGRTDISVTPLMAACYNGNPGVAKALLDHGANWRAVNDYGSWPLTFARIYDNPKCARAIVTHSSVPSATDIDNPLTYAASLGDAKTLKFLLGLGVLDVNGVNKKGFSALFCGASSKKRSRAICKSLLDKGSAIDGSDPRGVPLFAAARLGNVDAIALFLKRGADVKRRDVLLNRTALFFAVQADGTGSVNRLADTCAALSEEDESLLRAWRADQLGQMDNRGRTPLWYAAAAGDGRQATIKLLLENGLDRFVRDTLSRGILEIVLHDNTESRKLLVEGLPQGRGNPESVQDTGDGDSGEALSTTPAVLLQEPTIDADELKKLEGCQRYRSITYIRGTTACSECSKSYMTGYFWRE